MPYEPSTTCEKTAQAAVDLACETLYRFLAACLTDPRRDEFRLVLDPASRQLARQAANLLKQEFADASLPLGFGELPIEELRMDHLLDALAQPLSRLQDDYVAVFGLSICRECPPYETEFQRVDEVFYRTQQMADVAGFYRAFGLEPTATSRERPDHLALELEFESFLLMKNRLALSAASEDPNAAEHADVCQSARAAFFRDHLIWWVPSFSLALRSKAQRGYLALAGQVLAAFLPVERARLGIDPPKSIVNPIPPEHSDECEGCPLNT